MTDEEYMTLLEKAAGIDARASCIAIDGSGSKMPAIVAGCFLYVACGEDTLVYVDRDMKIVGDRSEMATPPTEGPDDGGPKSERPREERPRNAHSDEGRRFDAAISAVELGHVLIGIDERLVALRRRARSQAGEQRSATNAEAKALNARYNELDALLDAQSAPR